VLLVRMMRTTCCVVSRESERELLGATLAQINTLLRFYQLDDVSGNRAVKSQERLPSGSFGGDSLTHSYETMKRNVNWRYDVLLPPSIEHGGY
jgi:hypothetical protein